MRWPRKQAAGPTLHRLLLQINLPLSGRQSAAVLQMPPTNVCIRQSQDGVGACGGSFS